MSNKIHYQTTHNHLRCAYGGLSSANPSEVTCCNCLRKMKGQTDGRPPKHGKPTHKVAITLSPKAFEVFSRIPKGERSQWVSELIEKLV